MTHLATIARACLPFTFMLVLACGDDDVPERQPAPQDIEIAGQWRDPVFMGEEDISSTRWSSMTVVSFDNEDNVAITQNPANDMFFPSAFNRIEWTQPATDGSFFYCFVDFGLPTAEAARTSTQTADASNPSVGGCGGMFPWTRLERR